MSLHLAGRGSKETRPERRQARTTLRDCLSASTSCIGAHIALTLLVKYAQCKQSVACHAAAKFISKSCGILLLQSVHSICQELLSLLLIRHQQLDAVP